MAKTISVDELTYSHVVSLAGKLMMYSGKPVSLGYTIYLSVILFDWKLARADEKTKEKFREMFKNISSGTQMDQQLEEMFRKIVGEETQPKTKASKSSIKSSTAYIQ